MELRHIRYFLALAREGNFTRAATALGIGQPPLSSQIKSLEQEVGALLFHRTVYGADLTSAGQAFLETIRDMPNVAERAISIARRAARGETGRLCIGFSASSAFNPAVPGAIRSYRQTFPTSASVWRSRIQPRLLRLYTMASWTLLSFDQETL